ncbi:MAG: hypothetical protein WD794_04475 [Mycobacteriales bacterium]
MRRSVAVTAAFAVMTMAPGLATATEQPGQEPTSYSFQQATFADQDADIQRLTEAVHMTKDDKLTPVRAFTGPTSMLADPDDPRLIFAATADLRSRLCYLMRSEDAGASWRILETSPSPAEYPNCTINTSGTGQTHLAWGSDGTLYYVTLGYGPGEGPREGNVSVILSKSTDRGESWSSSTVVDNRGKTDPIPTVSGVTDLTVDTAGSEDVIHVGYSQRYLKIPEDSPLNNSEVVVATSTDGGDTFEQVNVNEFVDVTQTVAGKDYPLIMSTSFGRPFLTAHDGVVLVVADSRTPFDVKLPGKSYHALPMLVGRSTDQGKTWTVTTLGPPVFTGTGAQTGMGWTPEGGPDGTFLAIQAATPETAESSGVADIVLYRSTDMGETWSEPVAIDDDDPADQYTSFYPQLSVAPNGRVDAVWQDNRDTTDYHFHVRYSYSTDGGKTWAKNIQVTDQPIDFSLGISFNSDIRQPPGVASANEYAAFGWADPRLGDNLNETQDNFGAVAQFSRIRTGTSVLPIVAAVFGGLAVAGIALFLASQLARRRRQEPAAPATA